MINQYKISVITASYNSVKTIEQTIQSVVEQTYGNIEYIIIDGGSTDGTVDVIKKYKDKISYWTSEPDKGIYDAFNKGVRAANGDYVFFLGADDCLCETQTIENIVEELCQDDVDVLSAAVWVVDEKCGKQKLESGLKAERAGYDFSMVPHQGMFVRRGLLLKNPFNTEYRIAADYLFFLTCFFDEDMKIKYINLPVAFFASGGISGVAEKLLVAENNKIRSHFGLPLCKGNKYKAFIKFLLEKIGVLDFVKNKKRHYFSKTWQNHHCVWKICRWCGRGV